MSIDTVVKRAVAEHIVVQGREDALRELLAADAEQREPFEPKERVEPQEFTDVPEPVEGETNAG